MNELQILVYPSPRLAVVSREVQGESASTQGTAAWLARALRDSGGTSVSGVQIGVPLRMFAFRMESTGDTVVLLNPSIVRVGPETARRMESCLSFPGVRMLVERPTTCVVRFWTMEGTLTEVEVSGQDAAVIQHECDHLDGRCFVERVDPDRRARVERGMQRIGTELIAMKRQEDAAAELEDDDGGDEGLLH